MRAAGRLVARSVLVVLAALAGVSLAARHLTPAPELALVVVAALAVVGGPVVGATWGLVAGWVVDLVPPGGAVLGLTALLYAAAGALAGRGRRDAGMSGLWVAVVAAAATAVVEGGRVLLALATAGAVDWGAVGLRVTLTTTAAVLAGPPLVRLERRLAPRDGR